jgi:hypothetical protein
MKRFVIAISLLIVAAAAGGAAAQCHLSGEITAAMTGDPLLPRWEYTLTVTWDTGSMYGLSHIDVIIDPLGTECLCPELDYDIILAEPSGTAPGEGGCTAQFGTELDCTGDPSIPGVDGTLLKFEPLADETCELDVTGTAVLVFYSDHEPYPIDADALALVDKFAGNWCFGHLTGVFPTLACDSVPAADRTWGGLKGDYR